MKIINVDKTALQKILDSHTALRKSADTGAVAVLRGADLRGVDLRGADLRGVDLRGARLDGSDLRGADLRGVDLHDADLRGVDLRDADLRGVDLRHAVLRGARLDGVDLRGARLDGADLRGVDLPICHIVPEAGGFIAFKKLNNSIATLYVPKSAQRVGGLIGRECRVSKAKVKEIRDFSGDLIQEDTDTYSGQVRYVVGKWVKPDSFNSDVRLECTNGIHVFITKKEAEEYQSC